MENANLGGSFTTQRYESAQAIASAPKRRNPLLLIVLLLIVLAVLFFGVKQFKNLQSTSKPEITPTPTQEVTPTDTPTPEESPTPEPTKTPTPKPTANPVDKATGLDRSELSVAVQNGSGEKGAASQVADVLKNLGYHVLSIGNADTFDFEKLTIQVKSGKSAYLPLLKKDLSASYTIGSSSAELSASSSADAVVIVGKQ